MTVTNLDLVSFLSGELSPKLRGRYDLPAYGRGAEEMLNFIAETQGQARYRSGFMYVNHTRRNKLGVFIPFQFNIQQAYLIEATDSYFRFYKNNAVITFAPASVSAATNANPGVFTSASHGMNNGDEIFLTSMNGMIGIKGFSYLVTNVTTNTFQITDQLGNLINTTSYGTYTGGGFFQKIYELASPYLEADLPFLQYTQSADTMYIVNQNYEPRKLIRSSDFSWSLATYTRTADPFPTSNDWPGAVRFYEARLFAGGTKNNPIRFVGSCGPDTSGNPRYDNYTVNSTPLDNDAVIFTMGQTNGQVDNIQWISGTADFLVIGCFGSVAQVYGSAVGEPITPSSITVKPMAAKGCYQTLPFTDNQIVFFIHRSQQFLNSVQYNFIQNNYIPSDRSDTAEHLLIPGIKQIVFQSSRPEVIWSTRNDGDLLGLTYKDGDNSPGWHHHKFGGSGKLQWLGVMPRAQNTDQLWGIFKRTINGVTSYSVEYQSDEVVFPSRDKSYTGEANKTLDDLAYGNLKYELQKMYNFLDMSLTYDGRSYGNNAVSNVTPGTNANVVGSTNVIFTASLAVFSASMVGREIWKQYSADGTMGGGRATITGYTDSQHVTCMITVPFDNLNLIPYGSWFLTATIISGLDHLNGQTVGIVTDGAVEVTQVVSNGTVTLTNSASVCTVGLFYLGYLKSMNLEVGGIGGVAQTKKRNVARADLKLLDTLGISFGTRPYHLQELPFRPSNTYLNRPIATFTGVFPVYYEDNWDDEKHVVIVQNYPLPANIQGIDVFAETVNE